MREFCLAALLVVGFFLPSSSVHAEDGMVAQDILWDCADTTDNTPTERMVKFMACVSYLMGAHDMMRLVMEFTAPGQYCPPPQGMSNDQLRRIVLKHIKQNPEDMHKPARIVVFSAMMRAFRCAKAPPKRP